MVYRPYLALSVLILRFFNFFFRGYRTRRKKTEKKLLFSLVMPKSNNYRVICRAFVSRCIISAQYITSLNHSSGITFETIGELAISNTQWNIIQKINLKPFFLEDQEAYQTWQIVNNSCNYAISI